MTSLGRALWALAGAGFVMGLATLALILTNDELDYAGLWAAGGLVVGWSFIGVGLFAWRRRPDNRVGMLMAGTGFAWLAAGAGLSDLPLPFTIGQVIGPLYFAVVIHLLLAFPSGRLQGRFERRLVAGAYLLTTVAVVPLWFFADPADLDCPECPENLLLVESNETLVTTIGAILNLVGAAAVAGVLFILVRRWRSATPGQRRLLVPVYSAGVAIAIWLIGVVVLQAGGLNTDTLDVLALVTMVPLGLVPYMFLATLIRARMIQTGAAGELIARMGETPRRGELREELARALGDPSLELVYWLPDDQRFVDARGRPVELPQPASGRGVTNVERDGHLVAAIVHDALILDKELDAIGAAAAMALENERLDAELRAKVAELRDSRSRMLRIGLEERRRLERDLHDGAQQRLVSMALNMRLARDRLRDDPDTAEQLLEGAGAELDAALEELRELARGIHPAVLSDRGLDAALETLARRAPLPVELKRVERDRLPEAIEVAAYFVVAEALTNVAKYADATHATVNVERNNGRLLVEVADDGVGGADPGNGTGLRGLADRLAVIEGRLEVDSAPGRGTTIRARIPCG
ncbi:MAG TPA: histidine kinase [Thermoleophilaceae bacterium]|nr:histidine kinase [Thermoleophilaceae bacterium]